MSPERLDARGRPLRHAALTKILCTLGPATEDDQTLEKLVRAGASLFRLNFSHGTFDEHKRRLEAVRRLAYRMNVPLTVIGDLQGPKIRIGSVPEGGIELERGQEVVICSTLAESVGGERPELASDLSDIGREVEPGHRVLINDGAVRLLVTEGSGDRITARVTVGGVVTSRKGLNLPDSELSVPALTERDMEYVRWSVENHLDYLALSFVRRASEVEDLISRLGPMCADGHCGAPLDARSGQRRIPVIAKIETPQAVSAIEAIAASADGIMVARGDLGVELDVAQVPMVQKRLIRTAHDFGKPCIVATQMLESMITNPHPTRAEVSDVANAIIDGADCVMLSGETAVGKYPIYAVETMRRVADAVESELGSLREVEPTAPKRLPRSRRAIAALTHGAWHMARDAEARAIVIWSQGGGGARYLSRHNFFVPILAFSSDPFAVRRMNLLHAVHPVLWMDVPPHRSDFAAHADRLLIDERWLERGDAFIALGGKPLDRSGSTNTAAVRFAGDLLPTDEVEGEPGRPAASVTDAERARAHGGGS